MRNTMWKRVTTKCCSTTCVARPTRGLKASLFVLFFIVSHDAGQNRVAGTAVPLHNNKLRQQSAFTLARTTSVLGRGHSHNDYWQDEPFVSAIQHGIRSIEDDVFPRSNRLLVGHTVFDLDSSKCIVSMYVQPMLKWIYQKRQEQLDKAHRQQADDDDGTSMAPSLCHYQNEVPTTSRELLLGRSLISFRPNELRGGDDYRRRWRRHGRPQQQQPERLQPSSKPLPSLVATEINK